MLLIEQKIREIKSLKEENISYYRDYKKILEEENFSVQTYLNIIKKNDKEIEALEKEIRKINGYKKINWYKESNDLSHSRLVIEFPYRTKKDFKENWLIKNDLPFYSEYFGVNSPYDCSGEVYEVNVKYKGRKVIIDTYRDL